MFDLYLPKDNSKENYGLIVYLHAGGFTTGDKEDDKGILEWLCSKGYVTAGINYTLRTNENNASVYSQSMEVKEAIPVIVEEAKKLGYNLNEMAVSGGSAGGTLAMLYAYRDAKDSPIPVKMMFKMVGPSSFFAEDWDNYGLDKNNVDYKYFETSHSGHGLQNDSKVYREFLDTVVQYLDKYMPVEQ